MQTINEELNQLADELKIILTENPDLLEYEWRENKNPLSELDDGMPDVLRNLLMATKPLSSVYSQATQLIDFRKRFSAVWHALPNDDLKTRAAMLRWVVETWGGIRGVHNMTFYCYAATINVPELARDWYNISSRSKCWAFVNPETCYVYDSRVSMALNAVLQNKFPKLVWQFYLASGRSADYADFKKAWTPRLRTFTYDDYCDLVRIVAEKMGFYGLDAHHVEFKLFMLGQLETLKTFGLWPLNR